MFGHTVLKANVRFRFEMRSQRIIITNLYVTIDLKMQISPLQYDRRSPILVPQEKWEVAAVREGPSNC